MNTNPAHTRQIWLGQAPCGSNPESRLNRPYTANGLNQYSVAGPATILYDPNGNLTSTTTPQGAFALTYDVENRLTAATGAKVVNLGWDPLGRLASTSGGSGGTVNYLYDGDELIAEYDGAGTLLRRYVHGADADDPLVWYEGASVGPNRRFLQTDHQGSVVSIVDAGGNPIATNVEPALAKAGDPWGIPASTNIGRFQYTGQAYIPELDMYHYKARVYSPTLGRFLQTDPIGYKDQVNLYAYVGNDPANGRDPTGMTCVRFVSTITDGVLISLTISDCSPPPPPGLPAGTQINGGEKGNSKKKDESENGNCPAIPSPGPGKATLDRNIENAISDVPGSRAGPQGGGLVNLIRQSSRVISDQNYKANPKYVGSAPFGNFNFGATFQASGFSLAETLYYSNTFQMITSGRVDPAEDIADVTNGYNYAARDCGTKK